MDFSIFSTIGNISLKLGEASGAIVKVELLMRVIAKHSQAVQDQLEIEINQASQKQNNKNFWDCKLEFLEKAILVIFSNKFDSSDIEKIKKIRCIRNKFLHIDFVDLMSQCFDLLPTGRQIEPRTGKRNILEKGDIIELIKSAERNHIFEKAHCWANEVVSMLENILKSLLVRK